jgi:hypothetical protein
MHCGASEEVITLLSTQFHGDFHEHWFSVSKVVLNIVPPSVHSGLKLFLQPGFALKFCMYFLCPSFVLLFRAHLIVRDLTTPSVLGEDDNCAVL